MFTHKIKIFTIQTIKEDNSSVIGGETTVLIRVVQILPIPGRFYMHLFTKKKKKIYVFLYDFNTICFRHRTGI